MKQVPWSELPPYRCTTVWYISPGTPSPWAACLDHPPAEFNSVFDVHACYEVDLGGPAGSHLNMRCFRWDPVKVSPEA